MRFNSSVLFSFALLLNATAAVSKELPIGKVGKSAKKNESKKAVAVEKCTDWHATALGSMGKLDLENGTYSQFYVQKAGKKNKYALETVNLNDLTAANKISMTLPKIDQVIYPFKQEGNGIVFVRYADNKDECFEGKAKAMAISFQKDPTRKNALAVLKTTGRYTSYALDDDYSIVDRVKDENIRFQFEPFVKKFSKAGTRQGERILWADKVGGNQTYIAVAEDKDGRKLLKYDNMGVVTQKLELKAGDRIVSNKGAYAVLRPSEKQNTLYFLENTAWSKADKTKVYKIPEFKGLPVQHMSVLFAPNSGTMFIYADSQFYKFRWNKVIVFDYKAGKILSELDLAQGNIPGEIHYDLKGQIGIVEEISAATKERKALHIFKISNLVWEKKTY